MASPPTAFLSGTPVSLSKRGTFHGRETLHSDAATAAPCVARTARLTLRTCAQAQMPSETPASLYAKSVKNLETLKSKRYPTFRKMQKRHNQGPAAFRQAQEAAEALSKNVMTELTQPPDELAKKLPRSRKHMLRDGFKLSELTVGMQLQGKVQNLVRHGAYVDVGAIRDGLVHVRDMSIDFVHSPADVVMSGDVVTVWIKYVNPVTNVLGLSMVKPTKGFVERTLVRDIEIGKRYNGTVERVTNYGAYVDIGAERLGFLHIAAIWGRRPRETLDELRIGQEVCVHVDDVDEIRSHIKLRARGKGDRELHKRGPLGDLAKMEEDSEKPFAGQEVVIRQAVVRPWDDDEDEQGEEKEEEFEDEDFEDMYEKDVDDDDLFSGMELLPADVTEMINESDDYFDVSDFQ